MPTTGTVYIDYRSRDDKGNVMVAGRVLLGNDATIEAEDLGLKTLRSIQFGPFHMGQAMVAGSIGSQGGKEYRRSFSTMYGSIGSIGLLSNLVRVRTYRMESRGTWGLRATTAQGTGGRLYTGTQAGSIRASYIAFGV